MNKVVYRNLVVLGFGLWLAGCGGGSSSDPVPPDLSGTIEIETNTRIDGDTADEARLNLAVSNDTPADAQPLPANATIGGYLSANQSFYNSVAGFLQYSEDRTDFYIADLIAGDRISLQVFASPSQFLVTDTDPPSRQIRVLTSEGGTLNEAIAPVSRSGDLDPILLTLPDGFESGSYLVEVTTSSGMPFRYVLSLADAASTASVNAQYSEPTFILDQAVVQMASPASSTSMARGMGLTDQRAIGNGVWVMRRHSGARVMSDQASTIARQDTLDWIRELQQQPGVISAEPDYVFLAQQVATGDDDFYPRQWSLPFMQVPLAWQVASGYGNGVGIAVMDTGVFRSPPTNTGDWHPDLAANIRLVAGQTMDFVSGELDIDNRFGDPSGRDTNPADPGDGRAQSSNFHGTHVAGIAAAADNDIGIVGVAPSALIYPVRVLGRDGTGSSSDLIAAINWAADQSDIDVVNLSLGGLGQSTALKAAIDRAWDGGNGQLIVAAAGNAGTSQPTYPAAYDNVIGVGAVDGAGVRAGYSNTGPNVDLVAPGGDASRDADQDGFADIVVSTYGTDDGGDFVAAYTSLQGTSMAAPHVAGVYALMKGAVPTLTPGQFLSYLRAGSLTRPVGAESEYGVGLIDALAAMDAALEGNFDVTLSASPSALQLNRAVLDGQLILKPFPQGEPVSVNSVSTNAAWLSATQDTGDPLSINVLADVSTLEPEGRYLANVVVDYNPDNGDPGRLTVPVSLELGTAADEKDAGRHYVLLINADDPDADAQQVIVTESNGRYRFEFADVPPGSYILVAGTDTDNNGFICENGEACAEYPVNGLPETIRLGDEPRNGVRLNTSFRRPALSAMGLPRVGFNGYPVKSAGNDDPDSTKEIAP